jgi:hypothetical protein
MKKKPQVFFVLLELTSDSLIDNHAIYLKIVGNKYVGKKC